MYFNSVFSSRFSRLRPSAKFISSTSKVVCIIMGCCWRFTSRKRLLYFYRPSNTCEEQQSFDTSCNILVHMSDWVCEADLRSEKFESGWPAPCSWMKCSEWSQMLLTGQQRVEYYERHKEKKLPRQGNCLEWSRFHSKICKHSIAAWMTWVGMSASTHQRERGCL